MFLFGILGILFMILSAKIPQSLPYGKDQRASDIFLICLILCLILILASPCVSAILSAIPPKDLTAQTVAIVDEDNKSIIEESTYYQDDNGDFYVAKFNIAKFIFVPFYRADYVKTELPDNAYVVKEK